MTAHRRPTHHHPASSQEVKPIVSETPSQLDGQTPEVEVVDVPEPVTESATPVTEQAEQVADLSDQASASFAEVLDVLQFTPWNGQRRLDRMATGDLATRDADRYGCASDAQGSVPGAARGGTACLPVSGRSDLGGRGGILGGGRCVR